MHLRVALILLLLSSVACLAAEPAVRPEDLPRVPPTEPKDVLKAFQVKKGFRLDLAAAEPLVVDPIALCFDENGVLFVVEMRDYSERRDERLGRIRRLEDTDNDGRFDKSTIYADGLPWPTALFCYAGGLFVGSTPDILYFRDTDHDGVSDEKHLVFTGFGTTVQRLNVQALLNSFAWGPDNRIYGLTSFNGGVITSPLDPAMEPLDLRGRNFSFDPRIVERIEERARSDPRAQLIRPESGGGQHGMSFDDFGRWFICSNSAHLQMMMYDIRYAGAGFIMPDPLANIPVDGPAAEVYRISPDEPWRVIRTKWRVAGLVSGPIEGGGRASGYFTGATGVTIYRGNAFPPGFSNNAFVGDAGGNLVHRKIIRFEQNGRSLIQPIAQRPDDEQRVEFLASTDNWFRPVQFANAPDGCLYIADMYREVIEHPWSLPESIKQHLDLNSGNDRGRIYRIAPEAFRQPPPPRLRDADIPTLVATLDHPNGWHRDTASRLLFERQDKSSIPLLRQLAASAKTAPGRLHALNALASFDALTEDDVITALRDTDSRVRADSLKLAENLFTARPDAPLSGALWSALINLHQDPDLRVRYQLAFTLGRISGRDCIPTLARLAAGHLDDPWMRTAILSASHSRAADLFAHLLQRPDALRGEDARRLLEPLVNAMADARAAEKSLQMIRALDEIGLRLALAHPVIDRLRRGHLAPAVRQELDDLLRRAFDLARDNRAALADRLPAIRFLTLASYDQASPALLPLLSPREPEPIRLAALAALDRFTAPDVAQQLVRRWETFTPRVRAEALNLLLRRADRAQVLLGAIEKRSIRRPELTSNHVDFLRNHHDAAVRALASRILAPAAAHASTRAQIVDAFRPALDLPGDAARGQAIFRERCISCHRLAGEGHALGPDLVTVVAFGREKLLTSILDPNREVAPNYLAHLLETRSGDSHLGLVQSETPAGVIVRQAWGVEVTVPRADIRRIKSQDQSLMPEGLEDGLNPQSLADLLEFITAAANPNR